MEKKWSRHYFKMIKKTSTVNPNKIVSAYKDNCSFVQGPVVEQFAPKTQDKPDFFEVKDIETVLSLKAETHNFPTTVEPFNGASTGQVAKSATGLPAEKEVCRLPELQFT